MLPHRYVIKLLSVTRYEPLEEKWRSTPPPFLEYPPPWLALVAMPNVHSAPFVPRLCASRTRAMARWKPRAIENLKTCDY